MVWDTVTTSPFVGDMSLYAEGLRTSKPVCGKSGEPGMMVGDSVGEKIKKIPGEL